MCHLSHLEKQSTIWENLFCLNSNWTLQFLGMIDCPLLCLSIITKYLYSFNNKRPLPPARAVSCSEGLLPSFIMQDFEEPRFNSIPHSLAHFSMQSKTVSNHQNYLTWITCHLQTFSKVLRYNPPLSPYVLSLADQQLCWTR